MTPEGDSGMVLSWQPSATKLVTGYREVLGRLDALYSGDGTRHARDTLEGHTSLFCTFPSVRS